MLHCCVISASMNWCELLALTVWPKSSTMSHPKRPVAPSAELFRGKTLQIKKVRPYKPGIAADGCIQPMISIWILFAKQVIFWESKRQHLPAAVLWQRHHQLPGEGPALQLNPKHHSLCIRQWVDLYSLSLAKSITTILLAPEPMVRQGWWDSKASKHTWTENQDSKFKMFGMSRNVLRCLPAESFIIFVKKYWPHLE